MSVFVYFIVFHPKFYVFPNNFILNPFSIVQPLIFLSISSLLNTFYLFCCFDFTTVQQNSKVPLKVVPVYAIKVWRSAGTSPLILNMASGQLQGRPFNPSKSSTTYPLDRGLVPP